MDSINGFHEMLLSFFACIMLSNTLCRKGKCPELDTKACIIVRLGGAPDDRAGLIELQNGLLTNVDGVVIIDAVFAVVALSELLTRYW